MAKNKPSWYLGTVIKTVKERGGTITSQTLKAAQGKKKKMDKKGKK